MYPQIKLNAFHQSPITMIYFITIILAIFTTNASKYFQFEGTPFHPGPDRCWAICDKYKVTKFYTAPTAIRALMKFGDEHVKK